MMGIPCKYLNLWRGLLLTLSLFACENADASHMMGADLQYQYLGNNQYKIIAKVYRDCRGIAFNAPSFGCFAGTNGGNGCGSSALKIARTGIRDITQRCSTNQLGCTPQNTGSSGLGIEEHTFETTVDFSQAPLKDYLNNSSCCEVTFYLGQCCRNGAITTGSAGNDFFTTCMINLCNVNLSGKASNDAPVLSNIPIAILCCNTPWYYNFGAMDTVDRDSIAYRLVSGISSLPNGSISYSGGFSSRYPMTPKCGTVGNFKCTPQPKDYPPEGFYFDTTTADMVVTPTNCSEVPVVVVELTEFRKLTGGQWVVVGKTRRDIQLWIMDNCMPNHPPQIQGKRYVEIYEGDTLRETIRVTDEVYTPYQSRPDTVIAQWNGGIKGASFTVVDPSKREKDYRIEWISQVGDASDVAYSYAVNASDQHCDYPNLNSALFKIKVKSRNAGTQAVLASSYRLFPNPATDQVAILGATDKTAFKVINIVGRVVMVGQGNNIDVSRLAAGLYWVRLENRVSLRLMID
jgi:hypothetical protein